MVTSKNIEPIKLKAGGPGLYLFGDEERNEINEVLENGHLYRYGDPDDPKFKQKVYNLEKEFASYSGIKHCLATSSGTSSLYVSLVSLGIGPGDEVIVPSYTFVASYSAIILTGAIPVIAEVDDSLTIDPEDIENRITKNTKAIMPVHMMGNPSKMDEICAIAKKHNLFIVEDNCQAMGATYKGKKVGTFSEISGFSLNIFKTITCGDGGLIITDDDNLYSRAFALHDQGHAPGRASATEIGSRNIIGFNFRLNELSGAVALAQVRKLDGIVKKLRINKARIKEALNGLDNFSYRKLNDPDGECATLLTLIFPTSEIANKVASKLGTKTLNSSGWHVYHNMEHILKFLKERGINIERGSYPRTDDILERALNVTVGLVQPGIGIQAVFGININSTELEINEKIKVLHKVISEI